ncbi:MAG: hypothetical protein K8T20_17830, partial [Planctomycetes bacterium]|nr:hypothetical protein [Planctomycetota bacterium]
MGLRFRALAVVGAILLLGASLFFGVTAWIILAGFSRVETADAEKNVARAREAIDADLASILVRASDWSAWDDCYRFALGQNPEFVATNLPDQGWQEQKSNGMVIFDVSGKVIYQKFWNLDANTEAPEPPGLMKMLAPGQPLNRHLDVASRSGAIVMLDEGPLLVASRPIITTAHTGPIAGTMFWFRWLSPPRLAEYQEKTKLALEVIRLDRPAPAGEAAAALAALRKASRGTAYIHPVDTKSLSGYALYPDQDGKPAFLLRVSMPREINSQARASLWTTLLAFGVLAAFFCFLMLFFIDRLVVRRALRMTSEVQAVTSSKDRTHRIAVLGSDELATLASNINALLSTIESAERDLVRAREAALQAARVKTQFLANVSHEIRTPLNGIIGLGRLALDTTLTTEQREYLQAIRSSGQILLALVNDILDLSKVESGKLTLEKIPFELRALLEETLVPLRPRGEERGLKLELAVAREVPEAFLGDPLRLRQVVTNLVGNALKFTLQGSVRILVAPGAPRDGH